MLWTCLLVLPLTLKPEEELEIATRLYSSSPLPQLSLSARFMLLICPSQLSPEHARPAGTIAHHVLFHVQMVYVSVNLS